MNEALTLEVESYLHQAESAGYIATIVRYEHPVDLKFYGINLLLFADIGAKISKSGEQWSIQFRSEDEYEIGMDASILAVVTRYWKHAKMGFSSIQRLEGSGNGFKQVPTPSVDVLPGQEVSRDYREIGLPSEDGTFIPITSSNQLESKDIGEAARDHIALVDRLLSLKQYNPRLIGTVTIPGLDLDANRIPFSIA